MSIKRFIIIIILLQFSCDKQSIVDVELESIPIDITEFHRIDTAFTKQNITGLKFYRDNSNFINVGFYESGKKKFVHPVSNGHTHGKYVDWFEDGKIKWERSYVKGNQTGLSRHFNEKGLIVQIDDNSKNSYTIFEYFDNDKSFMVPATHKISREENGSKPLSKYSCLSR